jgi:hypothetical protein
MNMAGILKFCLIVSLHTFVAWASSPKNNGPPPKPTQLHVKLTVAFPLQTRQLRKNWETHDSGRSDVTVCAVPIPLLVDRRGVTVVQLQRHL